HLLLYFLLSCFFFSSRRRHTRWPRDWSSDVCSSDLDRSAHLAFFFPGKRTRDAPIDRRIPRGPRLVAQPRRWLGGRCLCATRAVIAVPFRTYAQGTSWYEGLLLTAWQA